MKNIITYSKYVNRQSNYIFICTNEQIFSTFLLLKEL